MQLSQSPGSIFASTLRQRERCGRHQLPCTPAVPVQQQASTSTASNVTAVWHSRERPSRVQHSQQQAAEPLPSAVSLSVMGAGVFTAIPFLLMMLIPKVIKVRLLMRSYWTFAPLAVAYMGLLAYSYTPDMLSLLLPGSLEAGLSGGFNPQFFPQLSGIQQLFQGPATIASIILHILSINLFLGRGIYFDGFSAEVPTCHSLLAAFFFGPMGLVLHWLTKAIYKAFPSLRRNEPVVLESNGGTITLMPYDTKE
ncbi:hypothetical protein DUNSADRAFT_10249 [Dunaliella salina]|uniref:Uncharacterized protein n=1 Tax=Dunaliella salina TaxID=3046 RepID=A0ABQ7GFS6_DUNSA|nr:hypothetical protein DUNSADRAFT_10249 [Dunaliella salina]|eukprot:KAF5833459.1 hypothetical protein DUNSADRAFT_10249 [Dunaliella salina]